jgi:hypothetical protein
MAASVARASDAIVATMLTPKKRHQLLLADRTRDAGWITAAIEHLLAANPDANLFDVETAFRDGAAQAYVIAASHEFRIVLGMLACRDALAEARVTAAENRAALGDTHPAVLPK